MGKKWERFYAPLLPPDGGELWINGQEAHHLLHVKRVQQGDRVLLIDGKGHEAAGMVVEALRDRARVAVESVRKIDREARIAITLAFSIPKGRRAEFLIQKCCELGVRRLIPLECERSVVRLCRNAPRRIERWKSVAVEASKQCGRTYITEISEVLTLKRLMNTTANYRPILLASTGTGALSLGKTVKEYGEADNILCIIGPEGGFTQNEMDRTAKAGCLPVTMGPGVLRIETAAVAIVSMLLYAYSV